MSYIKKILRAKFPRAHRFAAEVYYFLLKLLTGKSQTQIVFNKIYETNNWNDAESVSGPGSNLRNTENIRKHLPEIICDLKIKTILDIPCGDFFWMKETNLPLDLYIGADIIDELIGINNNLFGNEYIRFVNLDITKDKLPEADAVLCRDCLPHLPLKLIKASLKMIKESGSKYLFTSTYTDCKVNRNIHVGGFRPINLQLEPFNFSEPLMIINDQCITEKEILSNKSIGVWKIQDLP